MVLVVLEAEVVEALGVDSIGARTAELVAGKSAALLLVLELLPRRRLAS